MCRSSKRRRSSCFLLSLAWTYAALGWPAQMSLLASVGAAAPDIQEFVAERRRRKVLLTHAIEVESERVFSQECASCQDFRRASERELEPGPLL